MAIIGIDLGTSNSAAAVPRKALTRTTRSLVHVSSRYEIRSKAKS